MTQATLLLSGADVRAVLSVDACIAAVEAGFRSHAEAPQAPPAVLGIHLVNGGFHLKAAAIQLGRLYFAAKLNGNFPENPKRSGLPAIQGMIALCDGEDGRVLALMDSMEITRLRTGAATALAAKYLARPESETLTLIGCGRQSLAQLECLSRVLPLRHAYLHDADPLAADALASWARAVLGLRCEAVDAELSAGRAGASDVIVTCTPARRYFLTRDAVRPGTFIAAVGADDAGKQELEPALLADNVVVADVLEQCATIGELHHAIDAGLMTRADVHAELADLVSGRKPGRSEPRAIIVFDSTGTALEDVAAAAVAYERASAQGRGTPIDLAGRLPNPTEEPCNG